MTEASRPKRKARYVLFFPPQDTIPYALAQLMERPDDPNRLLRACKGHIRRAHHSLRSSVKPTISPHIASRATEYTGKQHMNSFPSLKKFYTDTLYHSLRNVGFAPSENYAQPSQDGGLPTFRCVIQRTLTHPLMFFSSSPSASSPSPPPHTGSFERGMARSTLVPHAPPRNTLRWLIAFSFARTTLVLIANQGYVIPPFIRHTFVDDSPRDIQDGDTLPNSSFLPTPERALPSTTHTMARGMKT